MHYDYEREEEKNLHMHLPLEIVPLAKKLHFIFENVCVYIYICKYIKEDALPLTRMIEIIRE